jgi:hypothetical protein
MSIKLIARLKVSSANLGQEQFDSLKPHLMHFVPSLCVLSAQDGVVVQQSFGDFRVVFLCDREINWRYVFGVSVVWRCAEFKKGSGDKSEKGEI